MHGQQNIKNGLYFSYLGGFSQTLEVKAAGYIEGENKDTLITSTHNNLSR